MIFINQYNIPDIPPIYNTYKVFQMYPKNISNFITLFLSCLCLSYHKDSMNTHNFKYKEERNKQKRLVRMNLD